MGKQTRVKSSYVGTMEIGGFSLRTRIRDFKGEPVEIPEHIVPIQQLNKKGRVGYACFQVRISKPWKSFSDLRSAIAYLEKEIVFHPPNEEVKFLSSEIATKKYPTGLVGTILQTRKKSNRNVIEIRLQLTFKRHDYSIYLGTLDTVTRQRYQTAFIRLYVIRRWMEKLTEERDFSWKSDRKRKLLPSDIEEQIPDLFRRQQERLAREAIVYTGYDSFVNSLGEKGA